MELYFLVLLIVVMIAALSSGFPVAFALPGAAVVSIGAAAFFGWLWADDASAYFASDGPVQWLSAGVTNFRGVYWEVERDTLIAIPLFIFMGIMLQRSKIAEDLLEAMGRLFGPVPGGLGISVVFVGALLAATTGIVGATVVAMGLISLPAMLRNGYSKSLATGTICASGTLGQIIPPSIVLIILADQLASAADQAATLRQNAYKAATGEFSMPAEFAVTGASAGDMFLGAFLPGLVLVGLYMLYILVYALIRPSVAPPVKYDGIYDRWFFVSVLLALVPPLALIFVVLGSIIMGVATVNQAGAIGAVGATIMAGYRLTRGQRRSYWPAILAILSLLLIVVAINLEEINIKSLHTPEQERAALMALVGVVGLMAAVFWSLLRTMRIDDTLHGVMVETAKTTSMVFIILIGAAMLTAAFRGFGGEELVREFLHGLPGGFWGQFIVVMLVIFLLGFFLDFIEIAVVVVPIVAPILLSDPQANITAVWLGVMIGLNIQTSFLTPPFGFALFYLRGVAPPEVKTTQIYKGASVFIALQLLGLVVVGMNPSLVNYLPARTQLTSETAPPPKNPRLQYCLEEHVFTVYAQSRTEIDELARRAGALDASALPEKQAKAWSEFVAGVPKTYERVQAVRDAEASRMALVPEYADYHRAARALQSDRAEAEAEIKAAQKTAKSRYVSDEERAHAQAQLLLWQAKLDAIPAPPEDWKERNGAYRKLALDEKKARGAYRRHVDTTYAHLSELRAQLRSASAIEPVVSALKALDAESGDIETLLADIKLIESASDEIYGASGIRSALGKARRELKKQNRSNALNLIQDAMNTAESEQSWRLAAQPMLAELTELDAALALHIGLRQQQRLSTAQAEAVASCLAVHRDISLSF